MHMNTYKTKSLITLRKVMEDCQIKKWFFWVPLILHFLDPNMDLMDMKKIMNLLLD